MQRIQSWNVVRLTAAVLCLSMVALAQSAEEGKRPPGQDWPFFGGDWTGQRHSTLTQINTQNVKTLSGAWTMRFDQNASTRATPVVKNGVMFVSAGSRLYALNAKTGERKWVWRPDEAAPERLEAANIGDLLNSGFGIPNPPGVSLGDGKVFVGLMDGNVAALDEATGKLLWTQQIGYVPARTGQAVSGTPIYARGVVYAGLANGDWAFRGKAAALDANTGKVLWEFWTIPGPGEPGYNTWPQQSDAKNKDVWKQGGGGIWHPPTVDPDLGLVYYITGNAVPMFGGMSRKGDNLYTASILALDMKTGKLKWHYQVVHHDLWDADIAIPHMLFDTEVNGKPRKALAAMRADGYLFLLDRATGKPLLPIEERKVTQHAPLHTSPTQPFPVNADSLAPPCSYWQDKVKEPFVLDCGGFTPPFLDQHNVVSPWSPITMTNRVTPMSYSPQTGYFYAQGVGGVGRARQITTDPWFRGNAAMLNDLLPPSIGVLAAIDSRTNKIVWKKELPANLGTSGPLTTAGGLMIRGDASGAVQAYDAKTGDLLWEFHTGLRGARGPAMSYEVDGEQYIALAMGTALWSFKLGGTLPARPAPAAITNRGPMAEPTSQVETATLVQSADRGVGKRYALDEHAFNPVRARIKAGDYMTFMNNGSISHTISGLDGSWTAGTLKAAESAQVKFDKPGTYRYSCREHPWAVGELTVTP
ncbi:MAG: PQQ-binding-like beta-propeller repeat protein [Vicinamibacterales bacterium]